MSLVVLHPRLYADLLQQNAAPHRSLKVRREIEKLRAKKREENRIQINLNEVDAQRIAGIMYNCDIGHYNNTPEEIRAYMEGIAKAGMTSEAMTNTAYIGYSNSEWKAMTEIASGLESTLDLNEIPLTVFYDMSQFYEEWFRDYLGYMVGRSYGLRAVDELERETEQLANFKEVQEEMIEEADKPSEFALAFGATGNATV